MTRTVWKDASDENARKCEALFQNGGPHTYTLDQTRDNEVMRPLSTPVKQALRWHPEGTRVYVRRRVGGKFGWRVAVAGAV